MWEKGGPAGLEPLVEAISQRRREHRVRRARPARSPPVSADVEALLQRVGGSSNRLRWAMGITGALCILITAGIATDGSVWHSGPYWRAAGVAGVASFAVFAGLLLDAAFRRQRRHLARLRSILLEQPQRIPLDQVARRTGGPGRVVDARRRVCDPRTASSSPTTPARPGCCRSPGPMPPRSSGPWPSAVRRPPSNPAPSLSAGSIDDRRALRRRCHRTRVKRCSTHATGTLNAMVTTNSVKALPV